MHLLQQQRHEPTAAQNIYLVASHPVAVTAMRQITEALCQLQGKPRIKKFLELARLYPCGTSFWQGVIRLLVISNQLCITKHTLPTSIGTLEDETIAAAFPQRTV